MGHWPAYDPMDLQNIDSWLIEYCAAELGVAIEQLSVDADYAELGLESVDLVSLVAALEEHIGRALSPAALAACRTLADLARAAGGAHEPVPHEPAPPSTSSFERYVNPELGERLRQLRMDKRFVRGDGCFLYDADGNRFLDFIAQYGALPFGYNPAEIWSALDAARAALEPSFVQPSLLEPAGELAARLVALAPAGMELVTFANSGAEAVEAAIKMCIAATGRSRVLSTHKSFHGKTLAALSATGNADYQAPFMAPIPGFAHVPYGDLDALEAALASDPDGYAAFLVEPIQGEGGIREPPAGYLRGVGERCRRAGVHVIVDEVQTGLGRTGRLFACESEDMRPSVITIAKALGGGLMPIGACLATREVYTKEFALKHSSTFAGNTLAARVGLATLDRLARDDFELLKGVASNGTRLKLELEALRARFPDLIAQVRGRGYLLGIQLSPSVRSWDSSYLGIAAQQDQLCALLSSYLLNVERVRVAPTLNGGDVLRIEPALTVTWSECELFLHALERAVEVLRSRDTGRLLEGIMTGREAPASTRAPTSARVREPQDERPHFAFIVHPPDVASFADFDPSLARLSEADLSDFAGTASSLLEPFVISRATVVSERGGSVRGEFIAVPATAEQLVAMPPAEGLALIGAALDLAKAHGARIVGLGGYTSIVPGGGSWISGQGIPITTGNSYTVASGCDAVLRSRHVLARPLHECTAAIVGAGGSIGRATAAMLAEHVARLILVGNPKRSEARCRAQLLEVVEHIVLGVLAATRAGQRFAPGTFAGELAHRLSGREGDEPEALAAAVRWLEHERGAIVLTAAHEATLLMAEIVVTATSSPSPFITANHLRRGAFVCELSRPTNVDPSVRARRPDVHVVQGGVIELPGRPEIGPFGLPRGHVYACMAETILLSLERRFDDLGAGPLRTDCIRELQRLAVAHGMRTHLPDRAPPAQRALYK